MKFCKICSSLLSAHTTGELTFHCICQQVYPSTLEDTLRFEMNLTTKDSIDKYATFIENSAFDLCGNKVEKTCICGIPFMTMSYIGEEEIPIYTCTCGHITGE